MPWTFGISKKRKEKRKRESESDRDERTTTNRVDTKRLVVFDVRDEYSSKSWNEGNSVFRVLWNFVGFSSFYRTNPNVLTTLR